VKYLTKEQILLIHSIVIDETGGSHGIRDRDAILALEALPRQKFSGKDLYKGTHAKAAVYARNIIMSHPFIKSHKVWALKTWDFFNKNIWVQENLGFKSPNLVRIHL